MNCSSYELYLNISLTSLLIISEILAFKEICCSKKKEHTQNMQTTVSNKPKIHGIIQGLYSITIYSVTVYKEKSISRDSSRDSNISNIYVESKVDDTLSKVVEV